MPIFDETQAGRAAELPNHIPELLFALLVPYLGPQEATEEMSRVLSADSLAIGRQ